ncbi:NAD(P)-binding protein [Annulohypoxylon maeteangense]|uniref:NAD(P)-binding protein n=1 Tax=Annulohypoxylon maeteangense TaxID=1927788 RepID=UPI0020080DB4|nr:NAD(P)-binding protein [Annulohypoxylon maeteangense]KAI0885136.1 NAD(P)-binding protein [Annulohypoxylon maeteangense]
MASTSCFFRLINTQRIFRPHFNPQLQQFSYIPKSPHSRFYSQKLRPSTTKNNMTGNVWFIAGASNGFGRAIGFEALKRGDKVVATSRNPAKMADLKEAGALVYALDVTADDATIQAAFQKAIDAYGKITHCINAAGYILEAGIEEASPKEIFDLFNTNVLGVINMTRNILHHMRPRREGVIANFGSLGSWRGGPGAGYYASTKFAMTGFTESLYEEGKELGISGVIIEPGYFRTGFLNTGGGNRLVAANPLTKEYEGTVVAATKARLNSVDNNQPGDVVKGAKVIVDVLTRTGAAEGKEIPMRLVLGADAVAVIKDKIARTEANMKEWEDVILSTDHDDVKK